MTLRKKAYIELAQTEAPEICESIQQAIDMSFDIGRNPKGTGRAAYAARDKAFCELGKLIIEHRNAISAAHAAVYAGVCKK